MEARLPLFEVESDEMYCVGSGVGAVFSQARPGIPGVSGCTPA